MSVSPMNQSFNQATTNERVSAVHALLQPNFYTDINGKNGNTFVQCCYVNTWNLFARRLSCRNGSVSCLDDQLAGPAWGHINMVPATLDWFLK